MLQVDLAHLARTGRVMLNERVEPDELVWEEREVRPSGTLAVELEVVQVGHDVIARGEFEAEVEIACRRCLEPVRVHVGEPLSLVYREGVAPAEAEDEESYPLPERGQMLDLRPAIREQWILSVPRYVVCAERCKGLCPSCGIDLNEGTCECTNEAVDERWGPLLRLRREDEE